MKFIFKQFRAFLVQHRVDHTFIGSAADLDEYAGIGIKYHAQGEPEHCHHSEQKVRQSVRIRRESVECYTLREMSVVGMRLDMEYQYLQKVKRRVNYST